MGVLMRVVRRCNHAAHFDYFYKMQGARDPIEPAELPAMASVTMAKEKEKILNFRN